MSHFPFQSGDFATQGKHKVYIPSKLLDAKFQPELEIQ